MGERGWQRCRWQTNGKRCLMTATNFTHPKANEGLCGYHDAQSGLGSQAGTREAFETWAAKNIDPRLGGRPPRGYSLEEYYRLLTGDTTVPGRRCTKCGRALREQRDWASRHWHANEAVCADCEHIPGIDPEKLERQKARTP